MNLLHVYVPCVRTCVGVLCVLIYILHFALGQCAGSKLGGQGNDEYNVVVTVVVVVVVVVVETSSSSSCSSGCSFSSGSIVVVVVVTVVVVV